MDGCSVYLTEREREQVLTIEPGDDITEKVKAGTYSDSFFSSWNI